MGTPSTLQAAIVYFSDADRAFAYAVNFRWPNGLVTCPRCGSEKHSFVKTRRLWHCKGCQKQFTLKVGTIFEDSPIGLDKWMMVMWMIANCKNGVSSYEIHRSIGVTQKTAWFMLHRIREAMKGTQGRTMGQAGKPVEVDETYIAGNPKNLHADRRLAINATGERKTIVMGMLDRSSREVRAKVVPNAKRETLQNEILNSIVPVGTVYTDGHLGYQDLEAKRYIHETVNHMNEYVRGEVHTNSIENFWACLKRTLSGTYIAVEPFHMDAYLAEQCFRFNNRVKTNDSQRFNKVLSQVGGKRLTYAELTGANGSH
jgi:transposase-like protein